MMTANIHIRGDWLTSSHEFQGHMYDGLTNVRVKLVVRTCGPRYHNRCNYTSWTTLCISMLLLQHNTTLAPPSDFRYTPHVYDITTRKNTIVCHPDITPALIRTVSYSQYLVFNGRTYSGVQLRAQIASE